LFHWSQTISVEIQQKEPIRKTSSKFGTIKSNGRLKSKAATEKGDKVAHLEPSSYDSNYQSKHFLPPCEMHIKIPTFSLADSLIIE
jgi:hypothetical protein